MSKKMFIYNGIFIATALSACNNVGGTSQTTTNNTVTKTSQVQNGSLVTDPQLNAMVPLIYTKINETGGAICTGTLLDATTVLTAAHCVIDMPEKKANTYYSTENVRNIESILVILSKDLSNPVSLNSGSTNDWNIYNVAKVYVHKDAFYGTEVYPDDKGFNIADPTKVNDLAIVKLAKPVSKQYAFASLATSNPEVGAKQIITGYGVNTGDGVVKPDNEEGAAGVLRMATSLVYDVVAGGSYIEVGGKIARKMPYTKICQGDSGGPDFIKGSNNNYIITGIHSFGDGSECGSPDKPSSSVSVAYYYDWINGGYFKNHL